MQLFLDNYYKTGFTALVISINTTEKKKKTFFNNVRQKNKTVGAFSSQFFMIERIPNIKTLIYQNARP